MFGNVKVTLESDHGFNDSISKFMSQSFPAAVHQSTEDRVDWLASEIISTNQNRYGPKPKPESLVAIRSVVRHAVETNSPIPILTPWGSRKPKVGHGLDVLELMALKQLACLNERISSQWEPGTEMRLRLEDASSHYLYAPNETPGQREDSDNYVRDFVKLARILKLNFLTVVPESEMFPPSVHRDAADEIFPFLYDYIEATDEQPSLLGSNDLRSWVALQSMGWKGTIPQEQRNYYRARYRTLYHGSSEKQHTERLARYFAAAWARVHLNGKGDAQAWGGRYLQVTFVPPIPGMLAQAGTWVYYRTIPMKYTTAHAPPWRSRGYLSINDAGEATPKLTNFSDPVPLVPSVAMLASPTESVQVRTDHLIE